MKMAMNTWNTFRATAVASLLLVAGMFPAGADDTEIYKAEFSASTGSRPKVLVVFDDSGSMATMVDQQRPPYDPEDATYQHTFISGGRPGNWSERIYWSTDGNVPPKRISGQANPNWFLKSKNRCASSYDSLALDGRFTADRARRWVDSRLVETAGYYRCENDDETAQGSGCFKFVDVEVTTEICPDPVVVEVTRAEWEAWPGEKSRDCPDKREDRCESGNVAWDYFITRQDPCTTETVTESTWTRVRDAVWVPPSTGLSIESWQPLTGGVTEPPHVECLNDVASGIANNGSGTGPGYPQDDVQTGNEYGPNPDPAMNWGTGAYTFYTGHYLDWYYDDDLEEPRSRIDIAQDVVSTIMRSNPGVDFGLMEFNSNQGSSNHGGRVVSRIIEDMTDAQRTNVVDMVNSMTADGATPLCESMYEAYRYLSGGEVLWGDDRRTGDSWPPDDALPQDPLVASGGTYNSPSTDCAYTYVILMTDGQPTNDDRANTYIEDLTDKTCSNYQHDSGQGMRKNCMPELAEYMANTDMDGDTTNGNQFGITYTIGFTTDQDLLADTAEKGKGEYYTANNAQELAAAFQGAIVSILATDTTFTSPAVAVDTFTRTQSRDEIFYAMFKPGETVDWQGNIKKLKLRIDDGDAVLVDANGTPAIDAATGFIKDSAVTFWGATADGGGVEKGGVGALLVARSVGSRSIYTNTGSGGALETLESDNITPSAMGVADDAELHSLFGVTSGVALTRLINWARGFDAYDRDGDGDSTDTRSWVMGDILHSQPLVLNYGARSGYSQASPDIRLLVGTNAGFVHMFGNDNGQEDWAFFPKELASILRARSQNALSSQNIYGMDLTPVAYTLDVNGDGTLNSGAGDKVWAYFGMRRGGNGYYALDISDPENPTFLWHINASSTGFSELGQTWSEPVVTRIPGYTDGSGVAKPVLIFGAGYDTNKDGTGLATPDARGRGIFIVDAETGALVWSVTPAANSVKNLRESGLQHSVAAPVTVLDGNGDKLTDRIYFADTGGNIWRVDLPGNALPTATQDTWQINQLASLGGGNAANDRRFFSAPDVVRIRFDGNPIDAILIGSGDRTNPNATDVNNRFYMIRDLAIGAYTTARPSTADCADEDIVDFRCFLPINNSSLYNITNNRLVTGTDEQRATALAALKAALGWRLDLTGDGEKSLSKSITLSGKVFFTTFTPSSVLDNINVCEPVSGIGRLYVVDLYSGDRNVVALGAIIPDTPSVHFGEDGQIRLLLPPGTPQGDTDGDGEENCEAGVCDIGTPLRAPYGDHWFEEGY
tara:strand:- start:2594 stop:6451 length:3858 start_codon:yes stop_codon:yes gene_type:complete